MKKSIFLSLFTVVTLLTACKKYYGDVNTNPNNPLIVEPKIMLPGIETALSYTMGGDAARFAGILSQQITGIDRQFAVLQTYKFIGSDVDQLYETNMYTKILMEIQNLKKISTDNGYHYYNGIAKSIEAYSLLFIADFFDEAPYEEAFKGYQNIQPKYNSNEELYSIIFNLLTEARADLSQAEGGAKKPADDDLLYGGNKTKWIGFTYLVEARANMRLAKKGNDNSKYAAALALINTGGLVDDCAFPYDGGAFSHPMFQFNTDWAAVELGVKIKELMTSYVDPRLQQYDQPFDGENTYFSGEKDHVILSMIEQEFIKAECNLKLGNSAAAHTNYVSGIKLALKRDGVNGDDITIYLAQNSVNPSANALTLEHIINQKYIALFMEHETFTDWRRTGFPTLTPNNGSQVPRRFPIPQGELNLNRVNAGTATIYKRVGWDVQ